MNNKLRTRQDDSKILGEWGRKVPKQKVQGFSSKVRFIQV